MARLHLHLRLTLAAALAWGAAGCGPEEVEIPDELRGEAVCMWIVDTHVHFDDGRSGLIFDTRDNWAGAGCLCMSEAEFESGARLDELNDLSLEVCEGLADQHEHVWNECQQAHDEERWFGRVQESEGNFEHPSGEALGCVDG